MYVLAGRPAFARPYVGVHRSTSLMSSSLLLQQCPACLVRLTWIVFMMGGRWPYSWCFVGFCHQDLFNIEPIYTFWVIKGKENKQIIFLYISVVVFIHCMQHMFYQWYWAFFICKYSKVHYQFSLFLYIYIYIYIYMCVCVCVCVCVHVSIQERNIIWEPQFIGVFMYWI